MSDIRHRKSHENKEKSCSTNDHNRNGFNSSDSSISNQFVSLSSLHWLFIILYTSVAFSSCYWADSLLPTPLSEQQAGAHQFSEMRAWRHLEEMSSFGFKPSGSFEAEVLTRNYILNELRNIQRLAKNQHTLEIDVQKPNDCYEIYFISHFISCYKNITNIAIKLSPSQQATNFGVLVNCHFDSAVGSPGTTDDLAACSVMLEMLNVLTQSETALKHNVIFLFNGAEENFLQGSHAFIVQHRWRFNIQAFVNMEGAGAGGREFLFQSGPANTWLLHSYLNNAPYPHGSILAQEIFESGILISDTDFRVFRDHGRLSGLDLAFTRNSYLYHSEFDDVDHVTAGSLQRLGDNVLNTVRDIALSPCLSMPCPHLDAKIVFFDVLGLFVVQYPRSLATPINYLICLLVVLKVVVSIDGTKKNASSLIVVYSIKNFCAQLLITLLSLVAAVVSTMITTIIVVTVNLTMCWYSNWVLLIPLYIVPHVIIGLSFHVWRYNRFSASQNGFMKMENVQFDAVLLIFAIILFVITIAGVQSTYFVLVHLLFPLLRDPLIKLIQNLLNLKRSPNLIFATQFILLIPVAIVGSYAVVEVIHIFIPLVGRAGSALNPEILIAAICFSATVSFILYLSNLVYMSKSIGHILKTSIVINLLILIVVCLTGMTQPFKFSPEAPTWRRLHAQHVRRRIHSHLDDTLPQEDSALWITAMDYRGSMDLPRQIIPRQNPQPNCTGAKDLFCALPYYIPARKVVAPEHTLWLPTPQRKPVFEHPVKINVISKRYINKDRVIVNLTIEGADHISVYLTPLDQWRLDYFVSGDKKLSAQDESAETHFIYLASVQPVEPWSFSVDMFAKSSDPVKINQSDPVLYIGAASHQMHGVGKESQSLKELSDQIKAKRQKSHKQHNWRWAMTLNSFTSDYLGIYV